MIPTNPLSRRTILCIDDDLATLWGEMALLERSRYEVLTVSRAQQGLQLATPCQCDAVLLEYEMRGMKGHEVPDR